MLRAHDQRTGEILADVELPAAQSGPPITYMLDGTQYITMFVGDGASPAQIVALSLPQHTETPRGAGPGFRPGPGFGPGAGPP